MLGRPALFELLTLVGYYATLALQLRVFRRRRAVGGRLTSTCVRRRLLTQP